jgi:hypothetical protein
MTEPPPGCPPCTSSDPSAIHGYMLTNSVWNTLPPGDAVLSQHCPSVAAEGATSVSRARRAEGNMSERAAGRQGGKPGSCP